MTESRLPRLARRTSLRRVLRAFGVARRSPSSARSASRSTRRSTASSSRTRTAPASSCRRCSTRPRGAAWCCGRGSACRRSSGRTRASSCARRARRSRAARVVLATGGLSLPKTGSDGHGPAHGRGARPLGRADDAGARAPRSRGLLSRAAVRRGARGRARGARRRADDRAAHRLSPLDALRGERSGGARRVAGLAAGAARGPSSRRSRPTCFLAATSRPSRASSCGSPPRARASTVARALSRWLPAAVAEAVAREAGLGETPLGRVRREERRALVRGLVARVAARRRQPRLRVRGGHGGRRAARRGRHAHDGVAPSSRGSSSSARCWTWTAGSAASTSSGRGRARGWRRAASPAGCDSLPRRERSGRAGIPLRRPGSRPGRRVPLLRPAAGRRARRLRLREKPARTGRSRSWPRGARPAPRRLRGPAARGAGLRRGDGRRARGRSRSAGRAASTSDREERTG